MLLLLALYTLMIKSSQHSCCVLASCSCKTYIRMMSLAWHSKAWNTTNNFILGSPLSPLWSQMWGEELWWWLPAMSLVTPPASTQTSIISLAKLETKYIVSVIIIIPRDRSIVNIVSLDNTNLIITILLRKIKVLWEGRNAFAWIGFGFFVLLNRSYNFKYQRVNFYGLFWN